WDYATNWSMHPLELITVIIPSFFGFQSPYYWGWMPFTTSTVYVGIIPVFLSVIGILYKRRGLALFFLILTAVILLMSFGKHFAPLYNLLFDFLPFFNKFRAPSTILHLLPFALGVLAAVGFSALTSVAEDSSGTAKARQRLVIALSTLSVLVVLIFLFKDSLFQFFSASMLVRDGELQQYQQQYGGRAGQVIDQLKEIRFYGNEVISGLWNDTLRFLLFAIAGIGATLLFLMRKIRQGQFAASLVVVLVVDLFLIDARFINPVPARALDENFRPDPAITFLKQQPGLFRILPLGNQFGDNTYAYHGLQSLGGYNAAKLKIYQAVLDSCLYVSTDPGVPVNMNVVNMLNARYVITGYPLPQERFPIEYKDDTRRVTIYRNPEALPRTFFVSSAIQAENDSEVFRIINSPAFDPRETAVIQGDVSLPERPADSTRVQLTGYKSRRITMSTYASGSAVLVLSEVFYPAGWKAYIDGEETPILRTNSILRSVLVPAGDHEIVFAFDPPTYSTGKTVTYAAWSLVLICIVAGLWRDPAVRSRMARRAGREQEENA
ncbi:MAG: YfhO family protein, partial [Ignavibacteria bacterium]|nr:YfhO family protein [Ignavibacteria bacterium]